MEDAGIKPGKKDSTILAAIPYILSILVGVLIYLIAKDDKFARYHALQAILFEVGLMVVMIVEVMLAFVLLITIIGYFLMIFVIFGTVILAFVFRLYMAYKAFSGESLMLPYVGKMALERV